MPMCEAFMPKMKHINIIRNLYKSTYYTNRINPQNKLLSTLNHFNNKGIKRIKVNV